MEHGRHLVDVVDEHGAVVGTKARRDIDKANDTYHTIFIFLVTPAGEIVLGRIPTRSDLPNLYAEHLGVPAATIRRSDESPLAAAQRSVERELFIDSAEVVHVGDDFLELPDNRHTYASVFYLVSDTPVTYSETDIAGLETLAPRDLRARVAKQPTQFAPTFLELWRRYRDDLPV